MAEDSSILSTDMQNIASNSEETSTIETQPKQNPKVRSSMSSMFSFRKAKGKEAKPLDKEQPQDNDNDNDKDKDKAKGKGKEKDQLGVSGSNSPRTSRFSSFSRMIGATTSTEQDKKHRSVLSVSAAKKAKEAEEEVAVDDDSVAFAFGCIIACLMGPEYFVQDVDPDYKWRHACMEAHLKSFSMTSHKTTMLAIVEGETMIEWNALAETLTKSAQIPPALVVKRFAQTVAAMGGYDARARQLLFELAFRIGVSKDQIIIIEDLLVRDAVEKEESEEETEMRVERERKKSSQRLKRNLKIGFGTVLGGVLIGFTGGIATPMVAAGLGVALGGATAAVVASTGVIAMGAIFGVGGAGLLAYKTNKRYGLNEFTFSPLRGDTQTLSVMINVAGWIPHKPSWERSLHKNYFQPFMTCNSDIEAYTLVWESKKLFNMANILTNFFSSKLISESASMTIKHTVFATLMVALALPATLVAAAEVIDNPWGVCANAAHNAGIELASLLLARTHGSRPVTLVGSSMGAMVVLSALKEMASRGKNMGLIQDVYLFGAPISGKSNVWESLMPLISGKVVNCLSTNDTFVKLMLRGLCVESCVAGLEGINHTRVVNVDCSDMISSHGEWVTQSAVLLQLVGLSKSYHNKPGYANIGDRVNVRGVGVGIIRYCDLCIAYYLSHHITSSHHVTSRYITSHHITSHHITSHHHITQHHIITSHYIITLHHHITLHHITLHHHITSSHYTTSHRITSSHYIITLHYITSHRT